MNINRYNYEEYFILYLDNELDAGGRLEVEAFAGQNPDLKSELDMLMQTKLSADDGVSFSDKGSLMRFHDSSVSLANYEEWLIAYIDNELSPAEKEDAEKFIAGNPSIQRELNLLQRAKLQPETIEFPGKESLYRNEENVRKMSVTWWRMAAAAILLLAISATAIILMTKNKGNNAINGPIATNGSNGERNSATHIEVRNNTPAVSLGAPKQDEQGNTFDHQIRTKPSTNTNSGSIGKVNNRIGEPKENNDQVPAVKQDVAIAPKDEIRHPNIDAPGNSSSPISGGQDNAGNTGGIHNSSDKDKDGILTPLHPEIDKSPVTEEPGGALDNPKAGNSDIQFASEKSGGGLRGFLRKVTRNIEKRTNIKATDDDDRLLIAGLAIKMN